VSCFVFFLAFPTFALRIGFYLLFLVVGGNRGDVGAVNIDGRVGVVVRVTDLSDGRCATGVFVSVVLVWDGALV